MIDICLWLMSPWAPSTHQVSVATYATSTHQVSVATYAHLPHIKSVLPLPHIKSVLPLTHGPKIFKKILFYFICINKQKSEIIIPIFMFRSVILNDSLLDFYFRFRFHYLQNLLSFVDRDFQLLLLQTILLEGFKWRRQLFII